MKIKSYLPDVNVKAAICVLWILLVRVLSPGQATTGTILGTVKDTAGGAVPSASVMVTNVRTQVSTVVSPNSEGDYIAPFLLPGEYQVSVEQSNFKKAVRSGITLQVGEKARADVTLEVGEISETVTATAEAPLVRSEGSEIAQVIEGRPIAELPLSSVTGRNFTGLVTLVPGTIRTNPVGLFDAPQGNSSFSVNGQRDGANNYMIDGADNNESLLGIVSVLPPPDAIAEFKIQTNSYSAEFGRAGGAVVN
ncbi:MAG: carboxypeptidase regulatory-like domain-containing protein, partial [Pyrinomonadaceae bacterium]